MKKIFCKLACFFTVLITAIFILSGCNSETQVNSSDSENISSSQAENSLSPAADISDIDWSSDYIGINYFSTFINIGKICPINDNFYISDNEFKIVSYIQNGEQKCDNFYNENFSDLSKLIKNAHLNNENINILYSKDYYDESSTYYEYLSERDIIAKYDGDWDILKNKVLYIDYRIDNREPNVEWINYFRTKITADTPIIIKEAYIFSFNGATYEDVTASNIADFEYESIDQLHSRYCGVNCSYNSYTECDIIPNTPTGEEFILYRMEALFASGNSQPLYFNMREESIYNCHLDTTDEQHNIDISFLPPLTNIEFMVPFSTYQFNEKDEIIKCPIYTYTGLAKKWFPYRGSKRLFVGDIDGNGVTDIILCNNDGNDASMSLKSVTIQDNQLRDINIFY